MAERKIWKAEDYVRTDWDAVEVAGFLEARARGYNGQLREILCTAAQQLRDQQTRIDSYAAAYAADEQEMDEVVNEMTAQTP